MFLNSDEPERICELIEAYHKKLWEAYKLSQLRSDVTPTFFELHPESNILRI